MSLCLALKTARFMITLAILLEGIGFSRSAQGSPDQGDILRLAHEGDFGPVGGFLRTHSVLRHKSTIKSASHRVLALGFPHSILQPLEHAMRNARNGEVLSLIALTSVLGIDSMRFVELSLTSIAASTCSSKDEEFKRHCGHIPDAALGAIRRWEPRSQSRLRRITGEDRSLAASIVTALDQRKPAFLPSENDSSELDDRIGAPRRSPGEVGPTEVDLSLRNRSTLSRKELWYIANTGSSESRAYALLDLALLGEPHSKLLEPTRSLLARNEFIYDCSSDVGDSYELCVFSPILLAPLLNAMGGKGSTLLCELVRTKNERHRQTVLRLLLRTPNISEPCLPHLDRYLSSANLETRRRALLVLRVSWALRKSPLRSLVGKLQSRDNLMKLASLDELRARFVASPLQAPFLIGALGKKESFKDSVEALAGLSWPEGARSESAASLARSMREAVGQLTDPSIRTWMRESIDLTIAPL